MKLQYYCDEERHLICNPYSIENLHIMAADLGIKKCWYHSNPWGHYDIPLYMWNEMIEKCILVHKKDIVRIKRGTYQFNNEKGNN